MDDAEVANINERMNRELDKQAAPPPAPPAPEPEHLTYAQLCALFRDSCVTLDHANDAVSRNEMALKHSKDFQLECQKKVTSTLQRMMNSAVIPDAQS